MGRIVWDHVHFLAHLFLAFFFIRYAKGKLDPEGTSAKVLTYEFH